MPFKDPQKRRLYQSTPKRKAQKREWALLHKDKIRKSAMCYYKKHTGKVAIRGHKYYMKNRIRIMEYDRKRRITMHSLFLSECFLCNTTEASNRRSLDLHEKYGRKHSTNVTYILKHKEDFVPLCRKCHSMVTRLMFIFGLKWEQINNLKNKVGS
jgi:hypothetical protein